ncbi:Spo0E family sporulation regulatory protein-aspartic acid phosphatase [Alicyclobacillus sp. ALC3]|uniref:Spo0E family sporulation regulatory protein-aspartic acid phosphatase n=1 Tax=Alicyclobacillus sp. ALC3 TaxID=2796143 RepID=UPI003FCD57A6
MSDVEEKTATDLENLRCVLLQTAANHDGQLLHPAVIAASQRLDEAVLAVQRQLMQSGHITSQACSTTRESGSAGCLLTLASM